MGDTESMNPLMRIRERARRAQAHIVLAEGTEPRVLQAARSVLSDDLAQITLLGDRKQIEAAAKDVNLPFNRVTIIDPVTSSDFDAFVAALRDRDPQRFPDEETARRQMAQVLWYGAMMVRQGKADGMVAGSVHTTADVLRSAIRVVGLAPGMKTVSSYFLMVLPKYRDTLDKVFVYADAGVVPDPNAEQLADIAIASAGAYERLIGDTPKVALLSFSTKGSAKHEMLDKITEALAMIRRREPNLICDGELQADAAIVPEVAKSKDPDGVIAGDANVLIFPDLNAGNIAYKLTERLANARAIGPLLSGLDKPINDLSRGCRPDDIVNAIAVAAVTSRPSAR
ncbi:MAG: phosphate acetyltransferase [Candidatus Zixiibacteriota bacterium]